jgi:predicted P-loop ATPase
MARGPRVVPIRQPPQGVGNWWQRLARDDRGRIIADLANVLIALRGDDRMLMAVAYDEMRQHSIVQREWPRAEGAEPVAPVPHETTDDDIARLTEWLQTTGIRRIGREIVGQAVEVVAHERNFHPVRDYLENLEWDGTKRIHRWLFTYFGAEDDGGSATDYVGMIGQMFLIAMIARIFKPGCQADYMLVLEGDQGILKSTACRALAGDWFSDSLPESITSKDARQHLRGKWLMEVSELAAFSKTEVEPLKAFISRREERYRPPFGRHDVMEPRQCVFIGTTNKAVYIKDDTGGRRFWPVKCTSIDVKAIAADRDQLFAEAVHAFRHGARHWPSAEDEDRHFKPQQERRVEDDPWKPAVADWMERTPEMTKTTVGEVAQSALGFVGASRIGTVEQRRIGSVLIDLGFIQHRTKKGRFYVRPVSDDGG